MADEKSSEVKEKEKEEGAAREEHRQSAMGRLEKTVKRHFKHFDSTSIIRISFDYMENSAASGRLTLEFSRRERRSRPSLFTMQFVVVSFVVDA